MRLEIEEIDTPAPTLCLNMIVKNESKIIRRLMESVSSIIDCYCICDTGSTDDTIEIINTFFCRKTYLAKLLRNHSKILHTTDRLPYKHAVECRIMQSY